MGSSSRAAIANSYSAQEGGTPGNRGGNIIILYKALFITLFNQHAFLCINYLILYVEYIILYYISLILASKYKWNGPDMGSSLRAASCCQ